jgi:hypothetical protein
MERNMRKKEERKEERDKTIKKHRQGETPTIFLLLSLLLLFFSFSPLHDLCSSSPVRSMDDVAGSYLGQTPIPLPSK